MQIQLTIDTPMRKSGTLTRALPADLLRRLFNQLRLIGLSDIVTTDYNDDVQHDANVRSSVTYAIRDTRPELITTTLYGDSTTFVHHCPLNAIGYITVTPTGRYTFDFDLHLFGELPIPNHPVYRG